MKTNCDCIDKMNELLKQHNAIIECVIFWGSGSSIPAIPLEKLDKKKKTKLPKLFPSFCPFCGVKYDEST